MNDREILIELIRYVQYLGGLEEKLADHLIANGVTVQKQGEWERTATGWEYCSCCENFPDELSSIFYDYCPHCGAKMKQE